jgi:hypothetical protein
LARTIEPLFGQANKHFQDGGRSPPDPLEESDSDSGLKSIKAASI